MLAQLLCREARLEGDNSSFARRARNAVGARVGRLGHDQGQQGQVSGGESMAAAILWFAAESEQSLFEEGI